MKIGNCPLICFDWKITSFLRNIHIYVSAIIQNLHCWVRDKGGPNLSWNELQMSKMHTVTQIVRKYEIESMEHIFLHCTYCHLHQWAPLQMIILLITSLPEMEKQKMCICVQIFINIYFLIVESKTKLSLLTYESDPAWPSIFRK